MPHPAIEDPLIRAISPRAARDCERLWNGARRDSERAWNATRALVLGTVPARRADALREVAALRRARAEWTSSLASATAREALRDHRDALAPDPIAPVERSLALRDARRALRRSRRARPGTRRALGYTSRRALQIAGA